MHKEQPAILRRRKMPILMLALLLTVQILIILVSFMGGYVFHEWQFAHAEPFQNVPFLQKEFALLSEAHQLLVENAYVPLPDAKKLEYGMIRGMLEAYGEPYTVFVEPPQNELQTNQLPGEIRWNWGADRT